MKRVLKIRASRRSMRRRAPRAGFTLIELMVAMLMFTLGMLAMASTSAVIVKQMGDSGRMSVAATVAKSRIERLRLGSCTSSQTGSATTRGIAESWTVTPMVRSAQIDVSVTYVTRRGSRSQSYRSMVPCV